MRLIDADALIERLKAMISDKWNHSIAPVSWAEAYSDLIVDIENEPTAQSAPQ